MNMREYTKNPPQEADASLVSRRRDTSRARGASPSPCNDDETLALAGYYMWAVLDGQPKLTLWGFCDFEFGSGFADQMYSLSHIDGIIDIVGYFLRDTLSHYTGRAMMLSTEHLSRFMEARAVLRKKGRFVRTATVNRRAPTSYNWMHIAEHGFEPITHGVFLAAAIAEGFLVEPIREDGRLTGDAWLNIEPSRERRRWTP
jgi:hypothetical protein